MLSRKSGCLRQKIKRYGMDREAGQAEWAAGLFFVLFLAVLLYTQLQLALYRESALYLEDALAASNLASAVIDLEEYGISHTVKIADPGEAYERYCCAVKENLGLDEAWECHNRNMISGTVQIVNYTIYNVQGDTVFIWQRDGDGQVSEWQENLGMAVAPNGKTIEATGVYSEICYPVEGFPGMTIEAHKGKLVDVVENL